MLPFTSEAFFAVFEQYNRAIWPAQIIAYLLGIAAVALALRPVPGSGRAVGAIQALAWLWNGAVYHFVHFATINIAAPVDEVFAFMTAYENFPRFMSRVFDVRPNARESEWHWTVAGPAGGGNGRRTGAGGVGAGKGWESHTRREAWTPG